MSNIKLENVNEYFKFMQNEYPELNNYMLLNDTEVEKVALVKHIRFEPIKFITSSMAYSEMIEFLVGYCVQINVQ